jgi:hypothetical protein
MSKIQQRSNPMIEELMPIKEARERVAKLAERDGEKQFAREVRAGCWDHRNDVRCALRGEKLRGEE